MSPALLQMRNSKLIYVAFFIQYICGCVPAPAFVPPGELLVGLKSQNGEGWPGRYRQAAWGCLHSTVGKGGDWWWASQGGGWLLRVLHVAAGCSSPHNWTREGRESKSQKWNHRMSEASPQPQSSLLSQPFLLDFWVLRAFPVLPLCPGVH